MIYVERKRELEAEPLVGCDTLAGAASKDLGATVMSVKDLYDVETEERRKRQAEECCKAIEAERAR